MIYRGFNHEGIPEKWEDDVLARGVNVNTQLKTFAIANSEYCAHCGLWYTEGISAYGIYDRVWYSILRNDERLQIIWNY